jgi:hypothetical protein
LGGLQEGKNGAPAFDIAEGFDHLGPERGVIVPEGGLKQFDHCGGLERETGQSVTSGFAHLDVFVPQGGEQRRGRVGVLNPEERLGSLPAHLGPGVPQKRGGEGVNGPRVEQPSQASHRSQANQVTLVCHGRDERLQCPRVTSPTQGMDGLLPNLDHGIVEGPGQCFRGGVLLGRAASVRCWVVIMFVLADKRVR